MAHQWWGHLVGWGSYRDVWLSEGFAEFSAGLVLEHTGRLKKANEFWERERRWILTKPATASLANDAVGPISLGSRLATPKNPAAYDAMVYAKGAYVLHMLRSMINTGAPKPDAAFQELMKDFVSTNAGKNATTHDFQAAVERHMTPALNLAHDGKMDWFFRQWIDGTEIPRFKVAIELEKKEGDAYRLKGTIAQEGVSESFRTLLPIYLEFDKGVVIRYGNIPLVGSQVYPVDVVVKTPKKPTRVLANALHEVLARD
jgi:aminopeptidase N